MTTADDHNVEMNYAKEQLLAKAEVASDDVFELLWGDIIVDKQKIWELPFSDYLPEELLDTFFNYIMYLLKIHNLSESVYLTFAYFFLLECDIFMNKYIYMNISEGTGRTTHSIKNDLILLKKAGLALP